MNKLYLKNTYQNGFLTYKYNIQKKLHYYLITMHIHFRVLHSITQKVHLHTWA